MKYLKTFKIFEKLEFGDKIRLIQRDADDKKDLIQRDVDDKIIKILKEYTENIEDSFFELTDQYTYIIFPLFSTVSLRETYIIQIRLDEHFNKENFYKSLLSCVHKVKRIYPSTQIHYEIINIIRKKYTTNDILEFKELLNVKNITQINIQIY